MEAAEGTEGAGLFASRHPRRGEHLSHSFFLSLRAKVDTVVRCSSNSPGIVDLLVPLDGIEKSLQDHRPSLAQSPSANREVWRAIVGSEPHAPHAPPAGEASRLADEAALLPWMRGLARRLCEVKSTEAAKVLLKALGVLRTLLAPPFRQGATARQLLAVRDCAWHILNSFHVMRSAYAVQAEAVWVLDGVASPSAWGEDETAGEGAAPVAALTADEFEAIAVAELCIAMGTTDSKEGAGAKSAAVQLLGHLCRCYDVAVASVPGLSQSALQCFLKVAGRLGDSSKAPQELGDGFFRGITDFLLSFPLSYGDPQDRQSLILLCHLCLGALGVALDTQAYRFTIAALDFLRQHARRDLAEPLYASARDAFLVLKQLWGHRNTSLRRAAYPATAIFLRAVADKVVEHGTEPAARELLSFFLCDSRDTLQDPKAPPTQVSLALVVLGSMAHPIRCLDSPEVLAHVFALLLEKSQIILPSPNSPGIGGENTQDRSEWQLDVVRLIPHLLVALSSFVGQLPTLHEAGVTAVEQLLDVLLTRFPTPAFFPRLRAVTIPALLQLLASLHWLQRRTVHGCRHTERENEEGTDGSHNDERGSEEADAATPPPTECAAAVPACLERVCTYLCQRTFSLAFAARMDPRGLEDEGNGEDDGVALCKAGTEPAQREQQAPPERRLVTAAASSSSSSPHAVEAYTELWHSLLSLSAAEAAGKAWADQMAGDHLADSARTAALCVAEVQLLLRLTCQSLSQDLLTSWDLAVVDPRTKMPVSLHTLVLRHHQQQQQHPDDEGSASAAREDFPSSPEDYRCFLLFVPFYTALTYAMWKPVWRSATSRTAQDTASTKHEQQQQGEGEGDRHVEAPPGSSPTLTCALVDCFSDWLVALVGLSERYPHVSGLFQLLYSTLLSGDRAYAKGKPLGSDCGALPTGVLPASADAAAAVHRHFLACCQRMRAYADELLYQCATFALVASSSFLCADADTATHSADDGAEKEQVVLLLHPFRVVLAARNTLSEDEQRTELLARNREAAMRVLAHSLRACPPRAATLLLPLVATPDLTENHVTRQGLAELAAEYGLYISAAALSEGARARTAATEDTDNAAARVDAQPVPQWLLRECRLRVPMPEESGIAFPVGRLVGPVAHLCLHGATRRERMTACELFHFIVTWLVGESAGRWYRRVLPVVAELAAGREEDGVAAALFRDLLMQCTRWFASAPPSAVPEDAREQLERVLLRQLGHAEATMRRTATEALVVYFLWTGPTDDGDGGGNAPPPMDRDQEARLKRVVQKLQAALVAELPAVRLGAAGLLREVLRGVTGRAASARWLAANSPLWWLHSLLDALPLWLARATELVESAGGGVEETVECLWLLAPLLSKQGPIDEDHATGLRRRVVELMMLSSAAPSASMEDSVRDSLLAALGNVFASLPGTYADSEQGLHAFVKANSDVFGKAGMVDTHQGSSDDGVAVATAALQTLTMLSRSCPVSPNTLRGECDESGPKLSTNRARSCLAPVFKDVLASASGGGAERVVTRLATGYHSGGCGTAIAEVLRLLAVISDVIELDLGGEWGLEVLSSLGGVAFCRLAATVAMTSPPTTTTTASDVVAGGAYLARTRPLSVVCAVLQKWPRVPVVGRMRLALLHTIEDHLPCLLSSTTETNATRERSAAEATVALLAHSPLCREIEAAAALLSLRLSDDSGAGTGTLWGQLLRTVPSAAVGAVVTHLLAFLRHALGNDLFAIRRRGRRLCQTAAALLLASGEEAATVGATVEAVTEVWADKATVSSALPHHHPSSSGDLAPSSLLPADSAAWVADPKRIVGALAPALRHVASLADSTARRVSFLLSAVEDISARYATPPFSPSDGDEESGRREQHHHLLAARATRQAVLAALLRQTLRLLRGATTGGHGSEGSWKDDERARLTKCLALLTDGQEDRHWAPHGAGDTLAFQLRVLSAAALVDGDAVLSLSAAAGNGGPPILLARLTTAFDVAAFGGKARTLLTNTEATKRFLLAADVVCDVLHAAAVSQSTTPALLAQMCVDVVHTVTTDELPLRWTELMRDTKELAHYHQVIRALVAMASAACRLQPAALFELLPVLSQVDLPGSERLGATVAEALAGLPVDKLEELCHECVRLQRSGLPREVWWTATHGIFLPALRTFPDEPRTSFFERHVEAWVQTAASPTASARQRGNAFVLLEAMYRLTDATALKGRINAVHALAAASSVAPTGTELTKTLIKATTAARKWTGGTDAEEALGLRQAAHRCLTAVLMATQRDEGFFRKLLLDPGTVDWDLLGRPEAWGPLPEAVDFPQIPAAVAKESSDWELRVRQFAMQDPGPLDGTDTFLSQEEEGGGGGEGLAGANSQGWLLLSNSGTSGFFSGAADRSKAGGLSQWTIPPNSAKTTADGGGGPLVDLDRVWKTTCCGALLALVDFLMEQFPGSSSDRSNDNGGGGTVASAPPPPPPPGWVKEVQRLLDNDRIDLRIRLVFVRLVQLRARLFFYRFAPLLAASMLRTVTDPVLGDALHYVARDAISTIADWVRGGYYNPDPDTARHLLAFVAHTAPLTETTYYARCNVELFRELCALVLPVTDSGCLPAADLLSALRPSPSVASPTPPAAASAGRAPKPRGGEAAARVGVGVQLCGVVLDQGISLASLAVRPSEATALHEALVRLLSDATDSVAVAAAEVLAMEVKALRAASEEGQADALQTAVAAHVQTQWAATHASQRAAAVLLREVRVMQESCPAIATALLPAALFSGFVAHTASNQLLVLEVLGVAPEMVREVPYFDTLRSRFAGALTKYSLPVCAAFYQLLSLLVPHLSEDELTSMTAAFLGTNSLDILALSEDGRAAFFKLATKVQGRRAATKAATAANDDALHRLLVERGLADDSAFVQDIVLEYLDSHLTPSSSDSVYSRVAGVLQLLGHRNSEGGKDEVGSDGRAARDRHWLQHAAVLMLSPARRTQHFRDAKFLFSKPLKECVFVPRSPSASLGSGAAGIVSAGLATSAATVRQLPLFSLSLAAGVPHGSGRAAAAVAAMQQQQRMRPTITFVGASQQPPNATAAAASGRRRPGGPVAGSVDPPASRSFAPRTGLATLRYSQLSARHGKELRSVVVPPTSTALFTAFSGTLQANVVHSSLLFTRKEDADALEESGASTQPPRRLIALSDAAQATRYMYKSHQQRLTREREERLQATERTQELIAYRVYRDGDVPDIETPLEAFVTPLQALCLGSEAIAAIVCTSLVEDAAQARNTQHHDPRQRQQPSGSGSGKAKAPPTRPTAASPEATLPFFARQDSGDKGGTVDAVATPQHVQEVLQGLLRATLLAPVSPTRSEVSLPFRQFCLEMALLLRWTPYREGESSFPSSLSGAGTALFPASEARPGGGTRERVVTGAVLELWELVHEGRGAGGRRRGDVDGDEALWLSGCEAMMRHGTADVALLAAQRALPPNDAADLALAVRATADGALDVAAKTLSRLVERYSASEGKEEEGGSPSDEAKQALLLRLKRQAAAALLEWDTVLDTFPLPSAGATPVAADNELRLYASLRVRPQDTAAALLSTCPVRDTDRGKTRKHREESNRGLSSGTSFGTQDAVLRGLSMLLLEGSPAADTAAAAGTAASVDRVSDCVLFSLEALPALVFARNDCASAHRLWLVLDAAKALERAALVSSPGAATAVLHEYFTKARPQPQPSHHHQQRHQLHGGDAALLDHAVLVRQAVWHHVSRGSVVDPADLPRLETTSAAALVALCRRGCDTLIPSRVGNGAVYRLTKAVRAAVGDAALVRKALWVPVTRAQLYHAVFAASYRGIAASDMDAVKASAEKLRATTGFFDDREEHALRADEALCTIALGVRSPPTTTAGGLALDALLSEAQALQCAMANLSRKGDDEGTGTRSYDLVLLDALDSILTAGVLSGQSRTLTATTNTPLDQSGLEDGSDLPTAAAGSDGAAMPALEACWLLYTQTMIRALIRGGGGGGGDGALLERVPRLLQIFELRCVCRTTPTPRAAAAATGHESVWAAALTDLAELPTHVWRPWLTQLINWLLRSEHPTVASILFQTAMDYPQLAYYPFNCAAEELGRLRERLPQLAELFRFFTTAPAMRVVREFTAAIHKLQHPGPRLGTALKRVFMDLQRAAKAGSKAGSKAESDYLYSRAKARFDTAFATDGLVETEVVHAAVMQDIERNLRGLFLDDNGQLVREPERFKKAYNHPNGVKKHVKKTSVSGEGAKLSAYSHWLATLGASGDSGAVLVPQQPTTFLHHHHHHHHSGIGHLSHAEGERIVAVLPDVAVMRSLQMPVQVRFLTTEGERSFLVKGGDDLRLDQRVEELFILANACLLRHERGTESLHIRHFSVVPASLDMGLIEWVPNTKVLQDVMQESLKAQTGMERLWERREAAKYAERYAAVEHYADSYRELRDTEVARFFDGLVKSIPADLLGSGLQSMAPDRCSWHATRGAFVRSNAAFATASYLFGIGDRHLGNCLVDTYTGEAVSIDFGRAFGSATESLVVPELIPFRLSPQLQAVQGALGNDLTSLYMQRAMTAFQDQRSIFEGLATAFVYEPIVDWEYAQESVTGAAVAEEKAMSVYRKLQLDNPCELLKADVGRNPNKCVRAALSAIEATIDKHQLHYAGGDGGERGHEEQAREEENRGVAGEARRIEAFVRCLVALATDSSILGRTYAGWQPLF